MDILAIGLALTSIGLVVTSATWMLDEPLRAIILASTWTVLGTIFAIAWKGK